MGVTRSRSLANVLLATSLAITCVAQDKSTSPLPAPVNTYPQIVRVSYVQGDVRVSRGKDWEKAEADLPLATGFSLVTGAGRAEIEFEDASTIYLAENSVLVCNNLTTTGGVPHTELALLSGTLTLNVQTMAAGERFSVHTATDRVTVRYPDKTFLRVDSYLDAMTLTSMGNTMFRVDRTAAFQTNQGSSVTFRNGQKIWPDKPIDPAEHADWDQWVMQRAEARATATQAVMKQSGLTTPVPGMAEMNERGSFYPCPPYGMCWEPNQGWAGELAESEKAAVARQTVSVKDLSQGGKKLVAAQTGSGPGKTFIEDEYFPCAPVDIRNLFQIDPLTGKKKLVRTTVVPKSGLLPYEWAVCHTGTWIRHEGRFAWVAGYKRHHHRPIRWVQSGKLVGFVPMHPLDEKGKPPVNLKNGIFHPIDKKGDEVEHIAYKENQPLKLLDEAPKEFRKDLVTPLERTEAPRVEAHLVKDALARGRDGDTKIAGSPISFDRKSQSFMVARQETPGGKMVVEPIGARDSGVQARPSGAAETARGGTSSYSGGGSSGGGAVSRASASAPAASAPSASSSASSAASSSAGAPKSH